MLSQCDVQCDVSTVTILECSCHSIYIYQSLLLPYVAVGGGQEYHELIRYAYVAHVIWVVDRSTMN